VRRLSAPILAAALLLGACGGSPAGDDGARSMLVEAVRNLQRSDGVTATLSLRSTTASLVALSGQGGDHLSAADARKILRSSISISTVKSGKGRDAAQVVVNVAGSEDLELRVVEDTLYVRAHLAGLFDALGKDPAEAAAYAREAQAAGVGFVQPLMEGRWLSLEGLDHAMGAGAATPTDRERKVVSELARSLEASTDVTSKGTGPEGTHLVATVSLREVVDGLREAAAGLGPGAPAAALPGQVPDEDVSVDLWVRDGRLTQVEIDLLRLRAVAEDDVPSGVTRLALRVALEDFSGAIEAPPEAVPVDLGDLFGVASASGQAAAPPSSAQLKELCEQLKGQPREVVDQFKDRCPELAR
jgi:hypothetical protein